MSTTTCSADGIASATSDQPVAALWHHPDERSPTVADENYAREYSLRVGNETSIGLDCHTKSYRPSQLTDEQRNRYEELDKHNRDNVWEYRVDVEVGKDYDQQLKLKSALGVASQLDLSEFHTQLVLDRLLRIDGQRFGQRTEAVAFCLCALVLNDEATTRYNTEKPYHPQQSAEKNQDGFLRVKDLLIDTYGAITERRLHSIYQKLAQGHAPTRDDEETEQLLRANTVTQRHPSFTPDHALPQSTGEA